LIGKDMYRAVESMIRYLFSLRPRSGRVHYFQTIVGGECVRRRLDEMKRFVAELRCPFCGRRFRTWRGVLNHVYVHRRELEELVEVCVDEYLRLPQLRQASYKEQPVGRVG